MGIAKFDDGIPDNPKFIQAGPVSSWLWFCGVLYCRRALTDGFIPKQRVPSLVVGLPQAFKHATRLVEVGLWHEAVGGYEVNDYLHWNPSKSDVEGYRAKDRERKAKQFPDRIPSGIRTESDRIPNDGAIRGRAPAGAKSKSTSESASEDQTLREESAREGDDDPPTGGVEPAWNHRGPAAHRGLVDLHRPCFVSPACDRGWCVPGWLVSREWLPQVKHDRAQIAQFIDDVLSACPAGPIGDDPIAFWRAMWKEAHGTRIKTAGASRTADTVDAGREHLRRKFNEFLAEGGSAHVGRALES